LLKKFERFEVDAPRGLCGESEETRRDWGLLMGTLEVDVRFRVGECNCDGFVCKECQSTLSPELKDAPVTASEFIDGEGRIVRGELIDCEGRMVQLPRFVDELGGVEQSGAIEDVFREVGTVRRPDSVEAVSEALELTRSRMQESCVLHCIDLG